MLIRWGTLLLVLGAFVVAGCDVDTGSGPAEAGAGDCHPSYEGACLDPSSPDYDCAGGSGDGPDHIGFVRVVGPDDYGLEGDGDGEGCE